MAKNTQTQETKVLCKAQNVKLSEKLLWQKRHKIIKRYCSFKAKNVKKVILWRKQTKLGTL